MSLRRGPAARFLLTETAPGAPLRAVALCGDPMDLVESLARLGRLTLVSDVLDLVGRRAGALGYTAFAIGAPHRGDYFDGYFHATWPQDWIEVYMREGLVRDDPLPLVAALNTMPVLWSEVIAGRAGMALSAPQRRAFEVGAAHGWCEGLLVPIHGPGAYLVLASFAGRAPVTTLAAQAELHLLSLHAHVHLVRLAVTGADSAMAPHDLSMRELEALACLVAGLSDASAAQKMGISARTVRFHIENARRKLGAKTRSQAVSAALSRGLLGG